MTSRLALLAAVAAGLLAPPPARGEEPHLQFARALRENGLPDLAADYLQRLDPKKLSPETAALVPLEVARARFDVATQEGDAGKRTRQFAAARAAYEAFLKSHPNHPKAAEARLDLARLVALQGKHLLGQARRQESKAARKDLTAQAGRLSRTPRPSSRAPPPRSTSASASSPTRPPTPRRPRRPTWPAPASRPSSTRPSTSSTSPTP